MKELQCTARGNGRLFAEGLKGMFTEPVLLENRRKIWKDHRPQIILRWEMCSRELLLFQKTVHKKAYEGKYGYLGF